jgi:hypothetical protein
MESSPAPDPADSPATAEAVVAATRRWVERAVIGLNLCPFAKAVHVKGQVRYVVSAATDEEALLQDLVRELHALADADPQQVDTTLLIHPHVLGDFLDFNDFLDAADAALGQLGYDGVLQIASLHPRYQFANTGSEDIGNYSNRSPYPTLHLLREDSIDRAVDAYPDAETIGDRNVTTLEKLGHDGWDALWREP